MCQRLKFAGRMVRGHVLKDQRPASRLGVIHKKPKTEDGNLERKRHPASDAARRLHQVHGMPIVAHHRDISLRQQVAHVHDGIHMPGKEVGSWNWLPQEKI